MPSVERELNHSDDARKTNNNHVYFVKRKATAPYLLRINFNNIDCRKYEDIACIVVEILYLRICVTKNIQFLDAIFKNGLYFKVQI